MMFPTGLMISEDRPHGDIVVLTCTVVAAADPVLLDFAYQVYD